MCGRYTQIRPWREIVRLYRLTDKFKERNTAARYNIAPTQEVLFINLDRDGNQTVSGGRWWLVPHWAKEVQSKYPMFNARSEDAEKKPSFRDAYKSGRCLLPADGWYEWTKGEDGGRDPWFVHLSDLAPFSFAGLWAYNSTLEVTSCAILTAAAVAPINRIHNRMPIALEHSEYDAWLDPETPVIDAKALLSHNLGPEFSFHRVGRAVNSSKTVNDPSLIEPLTKQPGSD
ncbi:SOS response-associated peptidase [Roseibium sp. SCP14]|uniref:SOS response-associated peptidase n=1 Tax=Roseibium sp. SCP14 TaxID=3141375 RepID=UPI003335E4D7